MFGPLRLFHGPKAFAALYLFHGLRAVADFRTYILLVTSAWLLRLGRCIAGSSIVSGVFLLVFFLCLLQDGLMLFLGFLQDPFTKLPAFLKCPFSGISRTRSLY